MHQDRGISYSLLKSGYIGELKGFGVEDESLPVCIPKKQDHALYALLSHSPVRKQSSRQTRSALVGSRVCLHRRVRVDSRGFSGGELASISGPAGGCVAFSMCQFSGG